MRSASVRIRPSILLFGDSITEFAFGLDGQIGWASLLASTYSRRADILSRGFSGYNSKHALDVLPAVLGNPTDESNARVPLLFCTVFFGANDASMPSARQYLNIEDYTTNVRQIVTEIRSRSSIAETKDGADETDGTVAEDNQEHSKKVKRENLPIVLLTPPPVSSTAWDHYCTVVSPRPLSPRSNENAKQYGARVLQVAKEMDCAVVNTFQILGGDKGEKHFEQYMTDGLHLNGEGNRLVYEGIMDAIKSNYEYLLPSDGYDGGTGGTISLEEKLWSELC